MIRPFEEVANRISSKTILPISGFTVAVHDCDNQNMVRLDGVQDRIGENTC